MKITLKNNIVEMSGDELRQYIDAKSVFTALESAHKTAKEVRGGMIWREQAFERRDDQHYTAVNSKGFEVDIVRSSAKSGDPHPVRLTDNENELFAVEAGKSGVLLDRPITSEMIVSVTGRMARMNTVAPDAFVKIKRWIATMDNRDALKRRRDLLQADLIE